MLARHPSIVAVLGAAAILAAALAAPSPALAERDACLPELTRCLFAPEPASGPSEPAPEPEPSGADAGTQRLPPRRPELKRSRGCLRKHGKRQRRAPKRRCAYRSLR